MFSLRVCPELWMYACFGASVLISVNVCAREYPFGVCFRQLEEQVVSCHMETRHSFTNGAATRSKAIVFQTYQWVWFRVQAFRSSPGKSPASMGVCLTVRNNFLVWCCCITAVDTREAIPRLVMVVNCFTLSSQMTIHQL